MEKCETCQWQKEISSELTDLMTADGVERYFYKTISEKNKDAPMIPLGAGLNVLIVSDRGQGRAKALHKFLIQKTMIESVEMITDICEYQNDSDRINPDILIFAAMQRNKENYRIFRLLKEKNPFVLQAMYASVDEHTERECIQNSIFCIGDCHEPLHGFVVKLLQRYENNHFLVELEMKNPWPKMPTQIPKKTTFFERVKDRYKHIFSFDNDSQ